MRTMDWDRPRLVLRFAVASFVVFLTVGVGVSALMVRNVRDRSEQVAAFHARFVTDAVLSPIIEHADLTRPLEGAVADRLRRVVRTSILPDGRDLRVKIWSPEGQVLFSDYTPIIGRSFPEEASEFREVMEGGLESGISDLSSPENVGERGLADKLFETYVPIQLEKDEPPVAIAEVYQRYSVIQVEIDKLVRELAISLAAGLLLLFAALLPIASRAARTLRRRNEQLRVLLESEQRNVAELRDLNQKKSDFVAAASHELRTPLTSILGYVKTLQRPDLLDEKSRIEFLESTERQALRLLRLIRNLLSTSRLESGARTIHVEPVDLERLTNEILAELPGSRDRVSVDVPVQRLVTDRDRLVGILTNLLDNALKYSPEGSPIEVGDARVNGRVELWIEDRGIGIDPEEHERIFERFHQVDQSATRRFGGVGLGLHVARELAVELGGEITVKSAPGKGSRFTLLLPWRES
jgi:signal transduction histidine kinase